MATKKTSARKKSNPGASKEIREEMHAAHAGKLKNEKQAIAIGLSRARRAGKDVPPPMMGSSSHAVRKMALKDIAAGKNTARKKAAGKKATAKKSPARKKSAAKKTVRKSTAKRRS
jgi:hypothetical protein